jgi:hypothetical protein
MEEAVGEDSLSIKEGEGREGLSAAAERVLWRHGVEGGDGEREEAGRGGCAVGD